MITVKMAGLSIGIDNKYDYVAHMAEDYITLDTPVFTVEATEEEMCEEGGLYEVSYSPGYLEYIVVYRKIAERLPEYDAFVFHGAVLNFEGTAYVFTAKSGTGKTTHTRLWLEEFGDRVHYLNGDKPIIRFIDGIPYASGTPWRGKEGYGVNELAPIGGIAFLSRAQTNSAAPIEMERVVTFLMTQMYVPKGSARQAMLAMRLADRLLRSVRLIDLKCNMDREAARVSYAALSGQNTEEVEK